MRERATACLSTPCETIDLIEMIRLNEHFGLGLHLADVMELTSRLLEITIDGADSAPIMHELRRQYGSTSLSDLIRGLHEHGHSIREIARLTGVSKSTVQRSLAAPALAAAA